MQYKFEHIYYPDLEVRELFEPVKYKFLSDDWQGDYLKDSIINCNGHFIKGFKNGKFFGCAWFNNFSSTFCEFNGLAKPKHFKDILICSKHLINHYFDTYNLLKIKTTVDADNKPALLLDYKIGFKKIALLKNEIVRNKKIKDRYLLEITQEDLK